MNDDSFTLISSSWSYESSSCNVGVDALFLMASLYHELNPLHMDGYELHLIEDLHRLLKTQSNHYMKYFILPGVPNETADLNLNPNTISTLWCRSSAPIMMKQSAAVGSIMEYDSLYSHMILYILIGNVSYSMNSNTTTTTTVNLNRKRSMSGNKNTAKLSKSIEKSKRNLSQAKESPTLENEDIQLSNPVFIHIIINRNDTMKLQQQFRLLHETISEAIRNDWLEIISKQLHHFGILLCQLLSLLKLGYVDNSVDYAALYVTKLIISTTEVTVENIFTDVNFSYHINSEEKKIIMQFKINQFIWCGNVHEMTLIENLADVLTINKDLNAMASNEICLLLRGIFGYHAIM
jgi:hypothetical protein